MNKRRTRLLLVALVACFAAIAIHIAKVKSTLAIERQAANILEVTGINGGLVVHVGCGDGKLTAALGTHKRLVVHGLAENQQSVNTARAHIKARRLYGKVSVQMHTEKSLPYIDNLVNLLICEKPDKIAVDEIMRVLVPNGIAYLKKDGQWTKIVKPRPEDIDEWTHYMHDPSNNAVANDSVVGPCKRLQWNAGPKWTRSHEKMSGVNALVSAGGRIFYIIDEAPMASIQLAPKWSLIARDAFNGTILWKRSIPLWYSHLWPLKSGPAKLPRRLVAVGDRVYVTLGYNAPVTALDAATGETLLTYDQSSGTEGIIVSDGVLFANIIEDIEPPVFDPEDPFCWNEAARARLIGKWTRDGGKQSVAAFQAETGRLLWRKPYPVAPLTLAADNQSVYFSDGYKIFSLHRQDGRKIWESESIASESQYGSAHAPTLVIYKDVILYLPRMKWNPKDTYLIALNKSTGKVLWKSSGHPRSGHWSPGDILVINDVVWSGGVRGRPFIGRNLSTGEVEASFKPPEMRWFHPRCYRSKATERYLLPSRTGIEFADVHKKQASVQHWVRGACLYGIMPCNGLIYTPPNPCACYQESKPISFSAFAPAATTALQKVPNENRLQPGPAYEDVKGSASTAQDSSDWPTYRHDTQRSGYIASDFSGQLKQVWHSDLGGRLSSLVSAQGRIFGVSVDTHTLHAIDAASGRKLWAFTSNARVDSPPTLYNNKVIFGSRDGWVYCLRAGDGQIVWRFLAAPAKRFLMSYGQLESVWPVHGNVLVQNDVACFVAGRNMFLDGGMRLYRLDANTGRMLSVTIMDEKDPETGRHLQKLQAGWVGLTMPVTLPDILSSDGRKIYMRSQPFDMEGRRTRIAPDLDVAHQARADAHLFSPTGFLDDTWFHRSYWLLGVTINSGWGAWYDGGRFAPAGRILSFNDKTVYGFGRRPEHYAQSPIMEYQLYAADRRPEEDGPERVEQTLKEINTMGRDKREQNEAQKANWKMRKQFSAKQLTATGYDWIKTDISLLARAMVLTNKVLFVAGPPNLVNEEDVWDNPGDLELKKKLVEQARAWSGEHGALLQAVDISDGKCLAEYKLDALPVFDGMICAGERLYISLTNGTVVCFQKK